MTRHPTVSFGAAVYITIAFLLFLAFLMALVAWAASPAHAQPVCMSWPDIKAFLAEKYREIPTSTGQAGETHAVQLLVSPGGETWTIVSIDRTGIACAVAGGTLWEAVGNPPKGEEPS